MKELTRTEEILLLAIWRLKDNAYGVTIRKQIVEAARKDYTYGTLYGRLEQPVRKGYVVRVKGEPTPERGGRSKTFYELTREGIQALKQALEQHHAVWQGIDPITLDQAMSS